MITVYCQSCDKTSVYTEHEYHQNFDSDAHPTCIVCGKEIYPKHIIQDETESYEDLIESIFPQQMFPIFVRIVDDAEDWREGFELSDEEIAKLDEIHTRYNQK